MRRQLVLLILIFSVIVSLAAQQRKSASRPLASHSHWLNGAVKTCLIQSTPSCCRQEIEMDSRVEVTSDETEPITACNCQAPASCEPKLPVIDHAPLPSV